MKKNYFVIVGEPSKQFAHARTGGGGPTGPQLDKNKNLLSGFTWMAVRCAVHFLANNAQFGLTTSADKFGHNTPPQNIYFKENLKLGAYLALFGGVIENFSLFN